MPLKGGCQVLPFDPLIVGERFMAERENLDLSRAELAAICDYSPEQVRRVEMGQQAPGAPLLAALATAGGDLRNVLVGAGRVAEPNYWDSVAAAEYRDSVRREAREWRRLRGDRRKKVLSEDEADLIEVFRDLSEEQRRNVLNTIRNGTFEANRDASGVTNITLSGNARAAGRDMIEGGKRRK